MPIFPVRPVRHVAAGLLLALFTLGLVAEAQAQTPAVASFIIASQTQSKSGGRIAVVFRVEGATKDFPVRFSLGGTATEGKDYTTSLTCGMFSSACTAAFRSADYFGLIAVTPMDDGAAGPAETIIITLLEDNASPPRYVLGDKRTRTITLTNE